MLVETMYHWTAPPTKGNRGSRGGRAGGKALVRDDIYKVAEGRELGYVNFLYERFGPNINDVELYKKGGVDKYRLFNVQISPSGDALSDFHKQKRSRGGRVLGKVRDGSDVKNKVLSPYAKVNKYVRETQKRVGKMKAGWTTALRAVDSKLPPTWVQTAGGSAGHYGTARGSYIDETRSAEMSGSATAINSTPYARDNDGMQRRAEKQTMLFLQKHGDKWLDRMVKKHNKVAA